MAKWQCPICGYIYDEELGIPEDGIAANTSFAELPADWACPNCGVAAEDFEQI